HRQTLLSAPHFAENIRTALQDRAEYKKSTDSEALLYDGFLNDRDRLRVETVRNATERELADFHPDFNDERLDSLLLRYKARNYPKTLSEAEMVQWEQWRTKRLQAKLPSFVAALQKLSSAEVDDDKQFLLQELQLWAESIVPVGD